MAGLAIAARNGWSAISMRTLADELGVSAMALYRVAPDGQQLRRLIADAAAPAVAAGEGEGLIPSLREWATRAYAELAPYSGLASFVIIEWTELPAWLDVVEWLLATAEGDGVIGTAAVGGVNAVFAYVLVRAQLRDAAACAPRRGLAPLGLQPRRYPRLRSHRREYETRETGTHFHFGLEALLAGLERTAL